VKDLDADGTLTCVQVRLDQLASPTSDIMWQFNGQKMEWEFTTPVDAALTVHLIGAYTGDGLHLHQHSGTPGAGTDLFHGEWTSTNVTGLHLVGPSSAAQAATITGKVDVTGAVTATSFAGPLTGNASTATALSTTGSSGQFWSYNNTWATPPGGNGGPSGYKVTGSNVTNSTTTPTNITGLAWSLAANTEYDFRCDITHQGTATSGPRFGLSGPASPTLVNIRWYRSTSATAQTQSNDTAFSAAAQTAAITTSGNTGVLSSIVYGSVVNGANAGTAQFTLTSSTAGQTVTVYRGSGCTVY
jgi:hypothetical protein